jgi:hypothetical protein
MLLCYLKQVSTVWYDYENWHFTLREESKLQYLEKDGQNKKPERKGFIPGLITDWTKLAIPDCQQMSRSQKLKRT